MKKIRLDPLRVGTTFDLRKLEDYIRKTLTRGTLNFVPHNAQNIRILGASRLSEGVSNEICSFSLTYTTDGTKQTKNFVIKIYLENKDPVLKMDLLNEDPGKCLREYQVLKSLERFGYPVPHIYVCETNSEFLGKPFIIMDKEEAKEKGINLLDRFAATLANLHNLKWEDLGIKCLKPPQDEYEFAKRQIIHFENLLNYLAKHNVRLKENFDWVIDWLRDKALMFPCDHYSLVHGDYCPGNVFLTKNLRMVITDWEWAEIGDPAYDVGYTYHYVRILTANGNQERGERTAQNFIADYLRNLGRDISQRIEFYKVAAALKLSIFYHTVISKPSVAFRYYGAKSLPIFPLLRWFLRPWPQYLDDFLKEKVK